MPLRLREAQITEISTIRIGTAVVILNAWRRSVADEKLLGVSTRRWVAMLLTASALGLLAAWVGLLVGSDKVIVCGSGSVLDRYAEKIAKGFGAGHIDGAVASYCYVPSSQAWVGAGAALMAVVMVTVTEFVRHGQRHRGM